MSVKKVVAKKAAPATVVKKITRAIAPAPVKQEIVQVAVESLKEWKDNPRKNDLAVPKLAGLLKHRKQVSPIVVWKKNNTIYKGNTTFKAAKFLGWKTVGVLFVDFPSEQAAIAYGIEDNKSNEWATWDDSILNKFLSDEKVMAAGATTVFSEKPAVPSIPKVKSIKDESGEEVKARIVVLICDYQAREDVSELLKTWIKTSGIKNLEVQPFDQNFKHFTEGGK